MSTMTSTATQPATSTLIAPGFNKLRLNGFDARYGDFRDDLARNGFAVVKAAVPYEKTEGYATAIYDWLEGFNLGFNRNSPSTFNERHLPIINEKGMCLQYGVAHEDFVWAIRSEPGVISAFEKVYDTTDLLVSFDAVNITLPRTDLKANIPWPHQDQNPEKPGFRCLQGLVNLLPNGPKDGGLIVCKGSHLLSEQYHREMAHEERIPQWTDEWYGFKDTGMKWLADHGCEWIKVTAEPGDLLLWDSRTAHYNLSPETSQPRFAVYTCYMPVTDATQEDLKRKKDAFETWVGTTHWPNAKHVGSNVAKRNGEADPNNRSKPVNEPVFTERSFKLTGIPYIQD